MEGLFTLLILSIVMAITSFVVGSLPLSFTLSPSQLRLISSIGMGVLVGTSLIVIIPEGVETLYSANSHYARKDISGRALDIRWQHQSNHAIVPRVKPDAIDYLTIPGPVIPEVSNIPTPSSTPTKEGEVHIVGSHGPLKSNEPQARKEESHGSKHSDDHEEESSAHAWIGISLISGFILMYLIDKLPELASSSKHQRPPYHISLDNLGSGLRRGSSPSRDGDLLEAGSYSRRSHSFATTTGLVIHAAADGIALGASSSNASLSFIIFIAIMVHKAPASFGLTSVLLKQGLSSRAARGHLLVFSLAAPVGALTTFLFVQTLGSGLSGDEAGTRWRTGMLLLFSAGTFLYVAMHTMQENGPAPTTNDSFMNGYGDGRDTQRSNKSMRDLIASVIGMILPLFLQIGHAH
ncbi:hypothetical protein VTN00DRAFT_1943 [Thermoascus crustaceus]|uniref:uncharacterized protein n=1 Tax=Thermoascus crustaceus TaxID=5088 RepID=UPI003744A58B